jgi:hypothetical protein
MTFEINNFRPDAELNSVVIDHQYTEKTPVVEIFSKMVKGEDTSKYGEKANKAYNYIKKLGADALAGDGRAKVELNTITSIMIQAPLLKRLNLFDFMGNVTSVAFNERLLYKVYKLQGKMSNFQANQGDVAFPMSTWSYREMTTGTISGGTAINYRELATGNLNGMGVAQEQVLTDMQNKIFYTVMNVLYSGVKGASGIKHFTEAAGITKTSVKDMLKVIRRWGNVGIFGDYSATSQLNEFAGFNTDTAGTLAKQLPIAVIEEIMKTGLISTFYGTPVTEIPNSYNLLKLNAGGDNYDTYLPEGLLFFLVTGELSCLQIGYRGGLQSASGFDVVTGMNMTRFDLEFGSVIIPEYIPMVGLVSDSNFAVNKL